MGHDIAASSTVERKLLAMEPIDISGTAAAAPGEVRAVLKAKAKAAAKPSAKAKGKAKVKAEFKPPGKRPRKPSQSQQPPTPASSSSSKRAETTSDEEEDEEEEEPEDQFKGEGDEEESDHEIEDITPADTPQAPENKKTFSQRKAEKTPKKEKEQKPFTGEGGVGALEELINEE